MMRNLLGLSLLLSAAPLAAGCGFACTAEAVAGVTVTVVDAATGARICDATVTIIDVGFSETLRPFGSAQTCSYSGAYERAGTYGVSASKSDIQSSTQVASVTKDLCHVQPVEVTLRLGG